MKKKAKSWRTSLLGWLTLIGAAATSLAQFISDGTISIEPVLAALAGIGLISARDQSAHDEEVGT